MNLTPFKSCEQPVVAWKHHAGMIVGGRKFHGGAFPIAFPDTFFPNGSGPPNTSSNGCCNASKTRKASNTGNASKARNASNVSNAREAS